MSKKFRQHTQVAPTVANAIVELDAIVAEPATVENLVTAEPVTAEPAIAAEPATVENVITVTAEPETENAKTGRTPKPVDPKVYRLNKAIEPTRGIASAMYGELSVAPASIEQLTARLMESGAYMKVAPQAALKYPVRPVNVWMTRWINAGVIVSVE